MQSKMPRFADRSLFLFSPQHPVRSFCLGLTGGSRKYLPDVYQLLRSGRTVQGVFNALVLLCVVASTSIAAYRSPMIVLKELETGGSGLAAVEIAELTIAVFFTAELAMRIIADGAVFGPRAYFRDFWNCIDFCVTVALLVEITCRAIHGPLAQKLRLIMVLRAFRLVNQSGFFRDAFHTVLGSGVVHLVRASVLPFCLVLPFAIYGLNIFNGLFAGCNDTSVASVRAGTPWPF